MPKNSWTDYSTTAASNTDVHSVSIAEGMAPSDVNNALRELMVDTANFDQGNVTLTSALAVASGGTGAATHTANNVLVGAGTSAVTSVAPSTSGNVLTSNGTVWASAASPATDLTAVADGSVGSPSIANSGDTNTGIYWPGADQLGLTTAGAAAMLIDASGRVTTPLQPMFRATASGIASNVTGDGTLFTVQFQADVFDIGGNYNTSNGIFTAPVTGYYFFHTAVFCVQLSSSHTRVRFHLEHSGGVANRNTRGFYNDPAGPTSNGYGVFTAASFVDMTASQTMSVQLAVDNGSKVVDLDTQGNMTFAGFLVG